MTLEEYVCVDSIIDLLSIRLRTRCYVAICIGNDAHYKSKTTSNLLPTHIYAARTSLINDRVNVIKSARGGAQPLLSDMGECERGLPSAAVRALLHVDTNCACARTRCHWRGQRDEVSM